MALLWESLATREVRLLQHSLQHRFKIPPGCSWVNYVRSHDDIGWTFSDEDAARLGINGYNHRQFLNTFYTGQFEGSFARGLPFQYNPQNGDMRISGTCASLIGLEKALQEETEAEEELAIRRILLIHSVILSIGGIPLIYLGDEVGTVNDYNYRSDPAKTGDSRWVHRPATDWEANSRRSTTGSLENRVFSQLCRLIQVRKNNPVFAGQEIEILDLGNPHILAYTHEHEGEHVLVLANFIEEAQSLPFNLLRLHGLSYRFTDLVTGQPVASGQDLSLGPYQFMWLAAR
jgi:amylosucrase